MQVRNVNRLLRALIRFCTTVIRHADPTNSEDSGGYGCWWRYGPSAGQPRDKAAEDAWQHQREELLRMLSVLLRSDFEPSPSVQFPETQRNARTFYHRYRND